MMNFLYSLRRTNVALLLAIVAALLAHASSYSTINWISHSINAVGAFLAVTAAIILWLIRKPYSMEFDTDDWKHLVEEKSYYLQIPYKDHKRPSPTISMEYYSHDKHTPSGVIIRNGDEKGYWTKLHHDNYRLTNNDIMIVSNHPIPEPDRVGDPIVKIRVIIK